MIRNLEYSELCHWISDLPGFVHYPIGKLVVTSAPRKTRHSKKKSGTVKNSEKPPLRAVVVEGSVPPPPQPQEGAHRPTPDRTTSLVGQHLTSEQAAGCQACCPEPQTPISQFQ